MKAVAPLVTLAAGAGLAGLLIAANLVVAPDPAPPAVQAPTTTPAGPAAPTPPAVGTQELTGPSGTRSLETYPKPSPPGVMTTPAYR